jgi:hypothetical protein
MPVDAGLKRSFEAIADGAVVHEVNQAGLLQVAKAVGVEEDQRSGICWELCRRWVQAVLGADGRLFQVGHTVYEVYTGNDPDLDARNVSKDYLLRLIKDHASRNLARVDGNYQVAGVVRGAATRRDATCSRFTVLRSRVDVIEHLYQNPGAYLFTFTGGGDDGGGHAFAFEVTSRHILFFDPNLAEFFVPTSDKTTRERFLHWYRQFWGHYYKTEYTRGERELTQYNING